MKGGFPLMPSVSRWCSILQSIIDAFTLEPTQHRKAVSTYECWGLIIPQASRRNAPWWWLDVDVDLLERLLPLVDRPACRRQHQPFPPSRIRPASSSASSPLWVSPWCSNLSRPSVPLLVPGTVVGTEADGTCGGFTWGMFAKGELRVTILDVMGCTAAARPSTSIHSPI